MVSERAIFFVIDTEVVPAYFENLLKFIQQHYILPFQDYFTNVNRTVADHDYLLSFTVRGPEGKGYSDVEIRTGKPIQVKMVPSDEFPQTAIDQLKEDLIICIQLFEEEVRETTLYFAWVEGKEVILEKALQGRRDIIYRLFSESMLLFFILFIAASILLFMFLGLYAPIMLVALQFVMVLFSDRVIMRMGDWRVTQKNPKVHLFQYHLSVEEYKDFQQRFSRDKLIKIKSEIYEKTLAVGKVVDCETAGEVLSKHGFESIRENMLTKIVNVYEIVKKATNRFRLPVPKTVIANNVMPNAAASGPSPSHGVILLTTGLLVQLEEDEVLSVVGHEFSHLKGRDPLVLFGLTAAEYLLRVYVFWPFLFLARAPFFFFFAINFYLFFALGVVYFVAKFFEARADLEAAVKIGQPKVLAQALRKIGFSKLQFGRIPAYKIQEWIGWDPHPPIYFRVARLEKLEAPEKVKHPLIQSIKDNIRGFLAALR